MPGGAVFVFTDDPFILIHGPSCRIKIVVEFTAVSTQLLFYPVLSTPGRSGLNNDRRILIVPIAVFLMAFNCVVFF